MAVYSQAVDAARGAVGDTLPRESPGQDALSSPRFLLFDYSKLRNAYLLHVVLAYILVVWIYEHCQRVIPPSLQSATYLIQSRLVHILASGVFFTGFVKDGLCIPRPLSPPLKRITLSSSAALEYGFPSTHSANAVSVAVYALFISRSAADTLDSKWSILFYLLSFSYASSIILGRLYCGMHGLLDVFLGGVLGAFMSIIECWYGGAYDQFVNSDSLQHFGIVILVVIVLVRIHPEPADDCPCFDDSVAFAGVIIGIELGNWHYTRTTWSWDSPVLATVPFDLERLGWIKAIARIAVGILAILTWRGLMKPALLRLLPPVFRVIEKLGLNLPRRFFVQAS